MSGRKITALLCAALILAGCADSGSSSESNAVSTSGASSAAESSIAESKSDSSADSTADSTEETSKPEYNENSYEVTFSAAGGIYAEKQQIELTSKDGGTLYYTTDGSDPRSSSTRVKYEGAITVDKRDGDPNVVSAVDTSLISGNFNEIDFGAGGFVCKIKAPKDSDVDKCTVIRACAEMEDGSVTKAFSNTYFIGTAEEHIQGLAESCKAAGTSLSVVSLSMNYDDLFSADHGIYVKGDIFDASLKELIADGASYNDGETARKADANYKQRGKEWERPVHAEFFEISPDGSKTVISQDCGIRVQGNYSRSDLIKGLRLYARNSYGEQRFEAPLFEGLKNSSGEDITSFKTLVLRAGGNCAFSAKFNDTYWQQLSTSLDCSTKASRPCVVYLNGEYWGLYVLEEDYSDNYFEDHYGVNNKDVIVYKGDAEALKLGYKLDEGELPEGEHESYYFKPLLDFFKSHKSLDTQEAYDEFAKLVDVESCRDYFLTEVWINNKWDWPGKNWSMWKTANVTEGNEYSDGRWRFMFYDLEFGGVSGRQDTNTNTIKDDNYKPKGLLDMDTNNPAVLCFAYLMTNEGFRSDYLTKLGELSEGIYSKDNLTAKLESLTAQYSPLYEQFFKRYPGTGSADEAVNGGYSSANCIKDFFGGRGSYIPKMVQWVEKQFK
ncbi:MAG: CotH kinase family protein [Ruminococcus sp.]|nr:CotH kinase family protein [Ruminococcus sp.]